MLKIKNNHLLLLIGLVLLMLSPVNALASNFVCGQDLDGNGVLDSSGETSSCTQIGSEQFCSIGALSCNTNTKIEYKCGVDNNIYSNKNECASNCYINKYGSIELERLLSAGTFSFTIPDGVDKIKISLKGSRGADMPGHSWIGSPQTDINHCNFYKSSMSNGKDSSVTINGSKKIIARGGKKACVGSPKTSQEGSLITETINVISGDSLNIVVASKAKGWPRARDSFVIIEYNVLQKNNISCTTKTDLIYSCPISGNSCVNNNGIQQCSPNKCVDLDATPAEEVNPPSVVTLDDGNRTAQGACMEQALLFAGRNLSCRKSSLFTSFSSCCKQTNAVYTDSTGGVGSAVNSAGAIKSTYDTISAAYGAYNSAIAAGSSASVAAGAATSAGKSALIDGIDPYSIMISLVISSVLEGCNQQDMETSALSSSDYCHFVGEYCQKKWKFIGCVQKAKSYCCFNSKLGRIIQEQGRGQMGMDWGSAESPSCGGFTPDQFQSLDFSRIDMSEYYGDIQAKGTSLIQQNITQGVEDYYRQIQK